jgi:hypothetical protein
MNRRIRPLLLAVWLIATLSNQCAWATFDAAPNDDVIRTAAWPFFFGNRSKPIYDSLPGDAKPHPAVARIIVPEDGATAFGSGTLVGVRENRGLVVTNWHVVHKANGLVKVVFPDGFKSHAKPLKVDSDWDLAALVIWRPQVEPVKIANQPPRPGDILTIHGYGRGKYRIATGRCTTFYAPHRNFPHEMVELDVEARQGDSGGPIFNQGGELAGVLFGAGQGTTLGSFAPRVRCFLTSVAPDIDRDRDPPLVAAAVTSPPSDAPPLITNVSNEAESDYPSSPWTPPAIVDARHKDTGAATIFRNASNSGSAAAKDLGDSPASCEFANRGWYDPMKSALAVVGLAAIALRMVKSVS